MSNFVMRPISAYAARLLYWRAMKRRERGQVAAAYRDLTRAARSGHIVAQHDLARAYQIGEGCIRTGARAKHWYRIAAEAGYPDAQFELGLILLADRGPEWMAGVSTEWLRLAKSDGEPLIDCLFPAGSASAKDPLQAFRWLKRAADAGKPEAQANLGWLYLTGTGCETDRSEAFRWFNAAVSHNLSQAALGLAEFHGSEKTSDYDLVESARWSKRAADLGNVSGAYRFGIALRDGLGLSRDAREAVRYLSIAAKGGHPTAGYELALLAIRNEIDDIPFEQAIEQLRQCAKAGHVQSALLLAELYGRGDRVKPDSREVATWYRHAAELGAPQAQFMIGCLYARGEGVESDLKRAATFFELAASSGHIQAAYNIGVFYLNGQGVERDYNNAKKWISRAADAGLSNAQLRLGQLLSTEAKSETELQSARKLIESAADNGSIDAQVDVAVDLLSIGGNASLRRALNLLNKAAQQGSVAACEILLTKDLGLDKLAIDTLEKNSSLGSSRSKLILAREKLLGKRTELQVDAGLALLHEAAAEGDAHAYFELGVLYCQGSLVPKDLLKGLSYYKVAGESGHPLGQYNAAIMLIQGLGTEQNYEEGLHWMRRARSNNVEQAQEFLLAIERHSGGTALSSDSKPS